MDRMNFFDRPLAFTDVETTGTDPLVHEIIEIGLVVLDPVSLDVSDELDVKVRPTRLELAEPEALKVNGYRPEDWAAAVPLSDAIAEYARKARDAVFMAHNATFDWPFVQMAFKLTGVPDRMDYHHLCAMSMAWIKLRRAGLRGVNLKYLARHLGVPEEPLPHRAINGARTACEVFRRLDRLP